MALFYTNQYEGVFQKDSSVSLPKQCKLSEQESLHCAKVLRLRVGDIIEVSDGEGSLYKTRLIEVNSKECIAEIEELLAYSKENERPKVHIAMAPTKQIDRVEWFVEKATEIGIGSILFFNTCRTERSRVNEQRIEKILISAMKQSLQRYKPILHEWCSWDSFICNSQREGLRYIAYCGKEYPRLEYVAEIALHKDILKEKGVSILIGPEGDFTAQEVEQAVKVGYIPVVLGPNRLRTETAALYAVCMAQTALL